MRVNGWMLGAFTRFSLRLLWPKFCKVRSALAKVRLRLKSKEIAILGNPHASRSPAVDPPFPGVGVFHFVGGGWS